MAAPQNAPGAGQGPGKQIGLPWPVKGLDTGHAYSLQPPGTTPAALNVRTYDVSEERARGGSRPGLRRAYTDDLGDGTAPVQWLGWLDTGFGQAVAFDEQFGNYTEALLKDEQEYPGIDNTNIFTFNTGTGAADTMQVGDTITSGTKSGTVLSVTDDGTTGALTLRMADSDPAKQFATSHAITDTTHAKTAVINSAVTVTNPLSWPDADGDMQVAGGGVYLTGGTLPYSDVSTGEYGLFSGATWQDFDFNSSVQWNEGTRGKVVYWVSSSTGVSTNGIKVTLNVLADLIRAPGLGFATGFKIDLEAEGNGKTVKSSWSSPQTNLVHATGGLLRVEANAQQVRVYWNSLCIIIIDRPAGAAGTTPCSCGGFTMSMSDPTAGLTGTDVPIGWDGQVYLQVNNWTLSCVTRPEGSIERKLVAIAGGLVYCEDDDGDMGESEKNTVSLATVPTYTAAHCNGSLFIVDGTAPMAFYPDALGAAVIPWVARRGSIDPTCRLAVNYRNRLVLSGSAVAPHAIFFSRVDDPWDFDFAANDGCAATSTSTGTAGTLSEPITALCPISDSMLIIGTATSVWALTGDPQQGGRIIQLSGQTGIRCQSAWTTDHEGVFYWLGSAGLYRLSFYARGARRLPGDITAERIPLLDPIDAIQPGLADSSDMHYVNVQFDAGRHGLNIWLTPYGEGTAYHYWYDLRKDGFWPESYQAGDDPTACVYYPCNTVEFRDMIFGTKTGGLGRYDETQADDELTGSPAGIASSVWLGPKQFAGDVQVAMVNGVHASLDSDSDAVQYGVYAAETVQACLSSTAKATGQFVAGRNQARPKVRGSAIGVKLWNATVGRQWALERVTLEVLAGGRVR